MPFGDVEPIPSWPQSLLPQHLIVAIVVTHAGMEATGRNLVTGIEGPHLVGGQIITGNVLDGRRQGHGVSVLKARSLSRIEHDCIATGYGDQRR